MTKISSLIKGWLNPALDAEQQMLAYSHNPEPALLNPLVEQFSDDLYHFLLAQSDVAMAEEILQLTWLKVMEKRQGFTEGNSVKSWLFTIARNTLIDELRRSQRWDFSDIDDAQNASFAEQCSLSHKSVEQLHNDREQQKLSDESFRALIHSLPLAQREAIVLQLEGFSIVDIAIITSEKTETIKSRLRYARQSLKKQFERINDNQCRDNHYVPVSGQEYLS
ncbi:sigma-70 family RNA polymerase sigma factor [Thalassotalea mangrovi]|uniref:Sigma-70 family RNA polymerase sigma factor n=1 Tax=Thalassotalea mangrovi TaxID=2572245 RepID=A0A4U1B2A5_9GAMM|nr:sigma-70 family RNA polymerase sigma factor [Thalassotalea mangrovi]TKB43643.1 sigma-70 family RNA polymerase sigma factor [Thalassotalea mangrovi]